LREAKNDIFNPREVKENEEILDIDYYEKDDKLNETGLSMLG
jgi:hypothetical protein